MRMSCPTLIILILFALAGVLLALTWAAGEWLWGETMPGPEKAWRWNL